MAKIMTSMPDWGSDEEDLKERAKKQEEEDAYIDEDDNTQDKSRSSIEMEFSEENVSDDEKPQPVSKSATKKKAVMDATPAQKSKSVEKKTSMHDTDASDSNESFKSKRSRRVSFDANVVELEPNVISSLKDSGIDSKGTTPGSSQNSDDESLQQLDDHKPHVSFDETVIELKHNKIAALKVETRVSPRSSTGRKSPHASPPPECNTPPIDRPMTTSSANIERFELPDKIINQISDIERIPTQQFQFPAPHSSVRTLNEKMHTQAIHQQTVDAKTATILAEQQNVIMALQEQVQQMQHMQIQMMRDRGVLLQRENKTFDLQEKIMSVEQACRKLAMEGKERERQWQSELEQERSERRTFEREFRSTKASKAWESPRKNKENSNSENDRVNSMQLNIDGLCERVQDKVDGVSHHELIECIRQTIYELCDSDEVSSVIVQSAAKKLRKDVNRKEMRR